MSAPLSGASHRGDMSPKFRRAVLAAAMLFSTAFRATGAQAQPATPVLDGHRDNGYQLLAQDPPGDLADSIVLTGTAWADLTNLYVMTDTTDLWVYAELPNYNDN